MGMSNTQSYAQILHKHNIIQTRYTNCSETQKLLQKYPPFSYLSAKIKIKTKFFIKKLIQLNHLIPNKNSNLRENMTMGTQQTEYKTLPTSSNFSQKKKRSMRQRKKIYTIAVVVSVIAKRKNFFAFFLTLLLLCFLFAFPLLLLHFWQLNKAVSVCM